MNGFFLPGFQIYRSTLSSDGQGGRRIGVPTLQATVSGRLTPLRASETPRAMQEKGVIALRFSCSSAVDLQKDDQIRKDGRTVKVDVVTRTSSGDRIEAICEEVTP